MKMFYAFCVLLRRGAQRFFMKKVSNSAALLAKFYPPLLQTFTVKELEKHLEEPFVNGSLGYKAQTFRYQGITDFKTAGDGGF
jgi:hypothetical protein